MNRYLLLISLLLGACSQLPPAIQDPPLYDLSYNEAIKNIASLKNAPVRWGGIIVEVENEQDFSLLQVLSYPLSSDGRPLTEQPHQGRFLIKSAEFLDPAVYVKNTEITVAGTLIGDLKRNIGNRVMYLPLLSATAIHLWPAYVYDGYYDNFGYYYSPYYGAYPYFWGGYYWGNYYPRYPNRRFR